MIEKLTGTYVARLPAGIILDVNGVGYGVDMPLSALCDIPPVGNRVGLWVHTHVREDAIKLFGFLNYEDRQAFGVLLTVSGVGPKVALAILSTLSVATLKQAVLQENFALLEAVPGIGHRSAEKIIVELKSKVSKFQLSHPATIDGAKRLAGEPFDEFSAGSITSIFHDVKSALENLGFKEKEVAATLAKLTSADQATEKLDFSELLRNALLELRKTPVGKNSAAELRDQE